MNRWCKKPGNTVKFLLPILMSLASLAATSAYAQGVPLMNVPTLVINDWNARALLVSGGQGSGCYAFNNAKRIPGPTLRTYTRYQVIAMASANCAEGTGLPGANFMFFPRPRPKGMFIRIYPNGIQIGNL
ncbi:hypothetical protein NRY95_07610 [Xanthomonas campestris pv. phormiicola]|nr:hypothetical protein [Xanthomonas campestris pv. phormiicola]UYC17808.1 hypothetical protein NRY95_07610 [Xanthomonas campestris pv. phormiicola]